jgi:gamma-glutamyltranspeptidase/glutathione hydrolase
MRVTTQSTWITVVLGGLLSSAAADDKTRSRADQVPPALCEGRNGVVVGTTGPMAVRAGLRVLQNGGSAADAALATALAQVVECGGCYVSHAGILSAIYFDAETGKVHYLNAGFNTPREEKDPLTIPGGGKPSGRTALVPGFMSGVQAVHDRFGKLSRQEVFAPAIELAEQGVKVSALLARMLQERKGVLSRLPETRRIFTKSDGTFYAEGEQFRQSELAQTLRQVADRGSAFMYKGAWAEHFVAAVQKEGGKITLDDMKSYRAIWEAPLQTTYRGHAVYAPGISSRGGIALIEALHLLELADLSTHGHYATTPTGLFWLMQIGHCQILDFGMDPEAAVEQPSFLMPDFSDGTPVARVARGRFDEKLLNATRALGQEVREISTQEADNLNGY